MRTTYSTVEYCNKCYCKHTVLRIQLPVVYSNFTGIFFFTVWFNFGQGIWRGCILPPHLFNLHTECIVWNADLDESELIPGRNRHTEEQRRHTADTGAYCTLSKPWCFWQWCMGVRAGLLIRLNPKEEVHFNFGTGRRHRTQRAARRERRTNNIRKWGNTTRLLLGRITDEIQAEIFLDISWEDMNH